MGIYERIRKLYEKAEQEAAEARARQQREPELLRAASRVAEALHAHGVKTADAPIHGWLIHRQTLPPLPPPPPVPSPKPWEGIATLSGSTSRFSSGSTSRSIRRSATVQYTMVEYYLGVDGRIYQGGKPIEHPANATIDAIEQFMAEIVVKNHLDPELFKDDDTQS